MLVSQCLRVSVVPGFEWLGSGLLRGLSHRVHTLATGASAVGGR